MRNRIGKSLAALAATSVLALIALLSVAGLRTQDNTGVIYDITSGQYQYNAGIAGIGAVPIPTTDTIVLTASTPSAFNSKVTIAANSLRRGRVLKIEAYGIIRTSGTPATDVIIRVRSLPTGTPVTLADWSSFAIQAQNTPQPWVINSSNTIQVTGAAGTAQVDRGGLLFLGPSIAATALPSVNFVAHPHILSAGFSTTLANVIGIEALTTTGTGTVLQLRQFIVRFEN